MKRTRVPGSAEAASDVEDRRLVQPALHDDVDLDREPGRGGRVDPGEHARDREVDVVHRAEDLVVERVEADRDPREPRVGERLRLLREERRVRRQRDVEVVAERRQPGDQELEVAAQQRLAARDAQLLHAEVDEDARDPLDLLEGEELAARQEAVVVAEDLLRHAVHAAEVAAVGDRDAEIADAAGRGCRRRSSRRSVENPAGEPARASPRSRRRHRDLGRDVRAGAGRDRALPAVRVPRRALRDLDGRSRAVRLELAAHAAAIGLRRRVSGSGCCSRRRTGCRRRGSSSRPSRAPGSSPGSTSSSRRCSRSRSSARPCPASCGSVSRSRSSGCCCSTACRAARRSETRSCSPTRCSRRSRSPRWSGSRRATTRAR